ncbi:A24 family peptidase [Geomonas sp.]|uniref:prepilin peptidase n=1 Tax=Geomonas sp. TaxID=2651584 RepID=UPI002B4AA478|nr:A24 family peptidase [Geomonas sp.]HJV34075.1 A24 family peptidase [Geomonas sp.]
MLFPYLLYVFGFILGAVVGSFLNVCICRIPKKESVAFPPSHCRICDYRLRWYDNIPILSYLLLKGHCRGCGEPISPQYPVVELINGVLTVCLLVKFDLGLSFAVLFIFCSALVTITFIDLEHQIIPDVITLPGIVVGFLFSFFIPRFGWQNSLIGILAGGGSLLLIAFAYSVVTKKDGMGGGDIKLMAMMGAFFGWQAVLFIIFASSLLGSLIGVAIIIARKQDSTFAIPFGPFLSTAAIVYIFYGRQIMLWYLSLGR